MKKAEKMTGRIAAALLSAMLAAGSVPGIVFASDPQWDPGSYPETAAEESYDAWEPGMSNGLQEGNEETVNDGSADDVDAAAGNTAVIDEANDPVMDGAAVDENTNEEGTAADTEWIGAVPEQETAGSGEVQENVDYSETVETVSEEDPFGWTEDEALVDDGMPVEDAVTEDTLAEDAAAEDTLAEDAAAGDTFAEDAAAGDTFAEDAAVGDAVTEDAATEDAASENPLISEGETETTEEQPSNADITGTIIDSGVCGNDGKVTWTLDEDGKLIIEGQGNMENYQDGEAPWYRYRDSIFTVVVESGVTDIGTYAFSGCSSISSIEFQEGLVNIFYHAFSGCSSISSIEFPEGLLNIYSYAFSGCGSLTSVKLPNSLEAIHNNAFSGCGSLTSIALPESLKHIFDGGFSDCSSLTSIELPNSMTSVDANVFSGCSSLTSVELPECLEYIGTNAFSNCSSLTSIELPESLTYISTGGFSGCSSLTSIELPEGFEMILTDVFSGCSNLERITLPASISVIDNAFSGCINLSEVIYVGTQWCWNQVYVKADFNGVTITFLNKNCIKYAAVTGLSEMTYTGEALTQSPVVEYDGTRLTEGTDYRVSYENNINYGWAGVIITGQGDYIGIRNESFLINQAPQTITASNLSLTYLETGTIKVSGNKGELSYTSSNTGIATVDSAGKVTAKGIGTAKITIYAEGTYNYEAATMEITVTVSRAAQSITASNLSLTFPNSGNITASGNKGSLSYESSNTGIATVDSTGKVTAKGAGKATITITAAATNNYNTATKQITVTVAKAAQTITASNLSLTYLNTGTITVSGNTGELSYKSSNTAVATVDSVGKVTAKGAGTAKITISAEETNNYEAATKEITVTVSRAAQTITASNLSLTYLKTGKIAASGNKGALSYKSSNTAIATVDSTGTITAKGAGKATITISAAATSNYNAATKTITVTVGKAAQSITAKAGASPIAVGKTTTVSITGNKGSKSFNSSDTTIATVDKSTGKVTARKVGTVKITAKSAATSNYNAASKTVTIKVVPTATASLTAENRAAGIKLSWKKVTGANGYKVYRGSTLIKTITSGSTVTFADAKANTNGTKYTYKVVAKGTTGDSTLSRSRVIYRVARPAVSSVTNTAASKMTVKWGKNAKAAGYVIHYSTDKTFKSGRKSATVTSASTVSRVIAGLTKGKTYYVRIRTYKTVGSAKHWSMWSAAKSVKISK